MSNLRSRAASAWRMVVAAWNNMGQVLPVAPLAIVHPMVPPPVTSKPLNLRNLWPRVPVMYQWDDQEADEQIALGMDYYKTSSNLQSLLEHVKIPKDRIEHWCTPGNRPTDQELLSMLPLFTYRHSLDELKADIIYKGYVEQVFYARAISL